MPATRRAAIVELKNEAQTLLGTATQEAVQAQIRLALRDLDEGLSWLDRFPSGETTPAILQIADLNITLAKQRLEMVETAIQKYGPDATVIGA